MAKYESQQWAEIGLGLKQYHKDRAWVLNNTTKTKIYKANYGPTSQLWAEMGMGLKQYHKCQITGQQRAKRERKWAT
jgi:hypothetical protein